MSQIVFSLLKACLFFFLNVNLCFICLKFEIMCKNLIFCQFHCLFWLSIQLSVPFVYSTVYSICQIIKTTLCKIDIFSDIAKTIRIQKLWSIKLSIQICSKFVIWMETLTLKLWYAINELYSQTLLNWIYNHIAQIKFMKRIERYIIKHKLISTLYRVYIGATRKLLMLQPREILSQLVGNTRPKILQQILTPQCYVKVAFG